MKIVDKTGGSVTAEEALNLGIECVKLEGHLYRVVREHASVNTKFTVVNDSVGLFNIKCGTLRGVRRDVVVEPVNIEITIRKKEQQQE